MAISAPSVRRKRRARLRWALPLAVAVFATSVSAFQSMAAPQPIGIPGSNPIEFDLLDDQGKWFDSGLDLQGDQSLAVAVLPTAGVAGGNASTELAHSLTNVDLTNSLRTTSSSDARSAPTIGNQGADPMAALNLDNLLSTVRAVGQTNSASAVQAAKAETLIAQLSTQLAAKPANAPVNLADMPVGAELMQTLGDLRTAAPVGGGVLAKFNIAAPAVASAHTVTGLIWPKGAEGFPFDQAGAFVGQTEVLLTEPGLYAFACKIHPYMLGAVVVDDPLTPGADFGKELVVNARGLSVPSNADIIQQLVNKFFVITNVNNWQHFSNTEEREWNPTFPPAPILQWDSAGQPVLVPNLDSFFKTKFGFPKTLPALTQRPAVPGVGELWIDTQMEKFAGKTKSGAATMINVQDWTIDRKIAAPGINMNNPHNMWTDRNYQYLYQTEWFSDRLSVFDRASGEFIRSIVVGPDPSHVMTRTDTDQLHVAINGGGDVVELAPGATQIDRRIPVGSTSEKIGHPHAHWMSADGKTMVTPNVNTYDSTVVDIPSGTHRKEQTGELPIASGMMPDSSKYYQANFLGQSVSCISLKANACNNGGTKTHNKIIDLWENYDPVSGEASGIWGGLPIQLPVSPDGKILLVANTLTSTIGVVDPKTDTLVGELACDAGCHGINFGAKKGGGYYAYISSKFSNAMQVVDPDPNGDGSISDVAIVGKFILDPDADTAMDDTVVDHVGLGGQGVLAIPLVYNGWSQQIPAAWRQDLTCRQINPIDSSAC
ncbi:MAG: copper oxidase [Pseudonocardiales bacterium]